MYSAQERKKEKSEGRGNHIRRWNGGTGGKRRVGERDLIGLWESYEEERVK